MKIAAWIARILLGVIFVGLGSMYWLIQPPPMEEGNAKQFFQVVASTHFMDVVKVCEVLGGVLVLSGRFAPLGLAILIPITFNILLFTTLVAPQFNPIGMLALALEMILMWVYWDRVKGVFVKP